MIPNPRWATEEEKLKLLHLKCGLFPDWPVLTVGQITFSAENRWNYTKKNVRVTLTQDINCGARK